MRFAVLIASVLLGLVGPSIASARDFERTCAYFSNVAFNDLHTRHEETFRVTLAKDCEAALDLYHVSRRGSDGRMRAEAYLVQLHHYRRTLIDMANARYDARRPVGGVSLDGSGRLVVRQVTRTGAYLIARSMGLIGTHREWRAWMEARLEE